MDRIITLLCALVLAAGAMFAWDRHAPISIPVLWWHLSLPPSLAQQRDDAFAKAAHASTEQLACLGELKAQNAQITDLSAQGETVKASAQSQLDRTMAENERLRAASVRISALRILSASPRCEAWETVDMTVAEALR